MNDTAAKKSWQRPNDPSVLILTSLADGAKHGYALSKDIEHFAGVVLSPGTLYGAITRLEESGLIEPEAEVDRRRPYRITGAGSIALAEVVADMARLAAVGSQRLGTVTWRFA
jgi:DNA-binding PadR family transcriptional regulator